MLLSSMGWLRGDYHPQLMLRVEIPRPGGKGKRKIGIPPAVDRLIQQALHQVLASVFAPGFSRHSYEYIQGRSAHQAVLATRDYIGSRRRWVVEQDLEPFFHRVNHEGVDESDSP